MQIVTLISKARRLRCRTAGLAREVRLLKSQAHRRQRRRWEEACRMIARGADPDEVVRRIPIGAEATSWDIV
jgi:hypothetical protein